MEESEAQFIKESNKFKLKKEELVDEIKLLKESIKKANIEESIQKKILANSNKLVKDKEAHNLHQKLENSLQTSKNLKENTRELKKDKTSSDKSLKSAEKIFKVTEDKLNEKIVILERKNCLAARVEYYNFLFNPSKQQFCYHI